MTLRSPAALRETGIDEQIRRLADCDESLSEIASNVTGLLDELSDLRESADQLSERLTEREALLAAKEAELSTLEAERSLAHRRADEASAALEDAERRLRDNDVRAEPLQRDMNRLRQAMTERDARLADVEAELSRLREASAEPEATPSAPPAAAIKVDVDREQVPIPRATPADPAQEQPPRVTAPHRDHARPISDASDQRTGHVRFAAFPEGYRLEISDAPCAHPGELVELDGRRFLVTRVGRSPLPGDKRPCAFLLDDIVSA